MRLVTLVVFVFVLVLAPARRGEGARAQGPDLADLPGPAQPPMPVGLEKKSSTKIIPLPIYSTLPNEGSTYGFMPVFLTVDDGAQQTKSIIAPSISWNRIIRFTHTFRVYLYPSLTESITIVPSVSTNVNRGVTFEYMNLAREKGFMTREAYIHFRRSLFYRFFGLGAETNAGNESSYTRLGGDAGIRPGLNITRDFNLGVRLQFERNLAERRNVDFLPLTHNIFPDAPGLGGSTNFFEGISLRYDTREQREYSAHGFASEAQAGYVHGLSGSNDFGRLSWEAKGIWEETSFLQGGARVFWGYTPGGGDIPFYNQSSLGGSFRLRGFTEDRFIDKGAWEAELEQRLTLVKTHIYGVVTDWRIDPFVALGQVYSSAKEMFRHTKVSGGLGFRAFVHPNVLGRVDTAVGGEGIKVYVELGYPF